MNKNDRQLQAEMENIVADEGVVTRFRLYSGPMAKIVVAIAVIWALFQIYVSSFGIMDAVKARAWFFGFLAVFDFFMDSGKEKRRKNASDSHRLGLDLRCRDHHGYWIFIV